LFFAHQVNGLINIDGDADEVGARMKIITFLTDFGDKDSYVAQMKGVACCMTDARLVDISHNVASQQVRQGAFLLWTVAGWFPKGTIHVAVVDPGVGTPRKALFVVSKNYVFVGPDNGVLMPACHVEAPFTVYEITHPGFRVQGGVTFQGRDLLTPIASYIANGTPFEQLGRVTTSYVDLQFPAAERRADEIVGQVLYIDHFGNLVTNIRSQLLPRQDGRLHVVVGKMEIDLPVVPSYGFVASGEPLLTVGSSGFLEIGVNQGSAAARFQASEDDPVSLRLV
jgi:S-adenosyl-L-methionine hydrolase (adenosine-forming)